MRKCNHDFYYSSHREFIDLMGFSVVMYKEVCAICGKKKKRKLYGTFEKIEKDGYIKRKAAK